MSGDDYRYTPVPGDSYDRWKTRTPEDDGGQEADEFGPGDPEFDEYERRLEEELVDAVDEAETEEQREVDE